MNRATTDDSHKTTVLACDVKALMQAANAEPDVIPKGFLKFEEWSKLFERGETQTKRILKANVAAGEMIRRSLFVMDPLGRRAQRPFWAVKK